MKYIQSSILASFMLLLAAPHLHAMDNNTEWGYICGLNTFVPYIHTLSRTINTNTIHSNDADKADIRKITLWLQAYIDTGHNLTTDTIMIPYATITRLFTRLQDLDRKYMSIQTVMQRYYMRATFTPNDDYPFFYDELTFEPSDDKPSLSQQARKLAKKIFSTAKTVEAGECVQLLNCSFVKYDMDNVINNIDSATNNAEKIRIDRKNAVEIRHWIELYRNSPKEYVPHATAATLLKRAYELTTQYAPAGFGKTELSAPEKVSPDSIFNDPLVLSSQNNVANFAHSALKLIQNRFVIAGGAVAAVATIYWYYTKEAPENPAQTEVDEELEITQEIN